MSKSTKKKITGSDKTLKDVNHILSLEDMSRLLFDNSVIPMWIDDFSDVVNELNRIKSEGVKDLPSYFSQNPHEADKVADKLQVVALNDATLKLFQARDPDHHAELLKKAFKAGAIKIFQNALCAIWSGQKSFASEIVFLNDQNHEIHAVVTFNIPKVQEGRYFIPISIIDVTDLKRTQKELLDHQGQLEKLVEERTSQLRIAQSELLQQERLATLGRLTSTVSHELRNPLGTISNGLNIIKSALEINDQQMASNALGLSERSVYRCDRIIEELLDYGRKGHMECKPVAIDELINNTLDEMKWPNDINLLRELAGGSVISGDKERLRRVVLNLVINALQALDESTQPHKSVYVKTRNVDNNVEIIIEDNGPGVPSDLHEKIFEPLFSTKSFGVGLGMTVVKDIVQMHNGSVSLQAPRKQGCKFVVQIPKVNNCELT